MTAEQIQESTTITLEPAPFEIGSILRYIGEQDSYSKNMIGTYMVVAVLPPNKHSRKDGQSIIVHGDNNMSIYPRHSHRWQKLN